MAYREDIQPLRAQKRLLDGRLRVDGFLTRSGVFPYIDPNGKLRREYRPPSEVFSKDSLDAYEGLIVTDDHPTEMVTLSNVAKHRRGQVGESVRRDGEHVAGSIYIDDAVLIRAMERKHRPKRQLSVGYQLDIDNTPGVTTNGERYDAIQRNIRPNHLAVVMNGRAGSAAVRMDSADSNAPFQIAYQQTRLDTRDTNTMPDMNGLAEALAKITILEGKLALETTRADTAEGKASGLVIKVTELQSTRTDSDQVATLTVDLETQTVRADAAEAMLANIPLAIANGVKVRTAIEYGARTILGNDEQGKPRRFDDLDNRTVQALTLQKLQGDDYAGESDDKVSARFDIAVEGYSGNVIALEKFRRDTLVSQAKAQLAAKPVEKRKDISDTPDWKTPLPSAKWSN